jgi:hypothetical protein
VYLGERILLRRAAARGRHHPSSLNLPSGGGKDVRHPAERAHGEPRRFERTAETASDVNGSPVFDGICVASVAAFSAVKAAGVPLAWQFFARELMTVVTLLLLRCRRTASGRPGTRSSRI